MFLLPFKAKWREGDKVWGWCIQMKVHFFYFQLSPVVSIDDRALLFLTRSFSLLRDPSHVSHTILWQQQSSEDAENPTPPWPRVSVLDHGLRVLSCCDHGAEVPVMCDSCGFLLWDQLIIPFHWAAGAPCYITNLSDGPATTWTLFSPCTRSFLAYDELFCILLRLFRSSPKPLSHSGPSGSGAFQGWPATSAASLCEAKSLQVPDLRALIDLITLTSMTPLHGWSMHTISAIFQHRRDCDSTAAVSRFGLPQSWFPPTGWCPAVVSSLQARVWATWS